MRPLTERELKLFRSPSIKSQLPVVAGELTIEDLSGSCAECHGKIDEEQMFGVLSKHENGVVSMESIGVCHACNTATPFNFRFHPDGRVTGLTDEGWSEWMPKESLIDRLKSVFRR